MSYKHYQRSIYTLLTVFFYHRKVMERIGSLLNQECKPIKVQSRCKLDYNLVDIPELGLFHEYLVMGKLLCSDFIP